MTVLPEKQRFLPKLLPVLLTSLFVLLGCSKKIERPDVFIFLVDTLRADHLGVYGFDGPISPNIDKFSKDSVVYENAIAPSPWTKPSIATLFTGLDIFTHKLNDGGFMLSKEMQERREPGYEQPLGKIWEKFSTMVLEEEFPVLAEIFQSNGYATGLFSGSYWISQHFGFGRGFESEWIRNVSALRLVDEGLKGLEKPLQQKKPIFSYFHFMDVHGPYTCNRSDQYVLSESNSLVRSRQISEAEIEVMPPHVKKWMNWPENKKYSDIRQWNLCYAAGVRDFDQQFGEIIDLMKSRGLYDSSLIIFTSDHGEAFLEHGQWDHGKNLYQELIHIPFIVKFPYSKKAGTRLTFPVSLIDIFPSLISYLGFSYEVDNLPGVNIFHKTKVDRPYVTAGGLENYIYRRSVQNEEFKLIYDLPYPYPDTLHLRGKDFRWDLPGAENGILFNLKKDPTESNPSQNHGMIEKMKAYIEKYAERAMEKKGSVDVNAPELSEETIENLKGIGYLQ